MHLLQPKRNNIYSASDGFDEEEIRKKLQCFPGGSIDLLKQKNGVAVLTINNPSRMNAFTGTMMVELKDRVTELKGWTDGKGLIVHGAANTFCSGSDLNAVRAISNPHDGMKMCMFMQNTLTNLMRLMVPQSEIRFVHKHMGLVPGWGGASRLIRIVGGRNALILLSSARKVDPEYGLAIGLADAVITPSDQSGSLEAAEKWLSDYIKGPATVVRAVKQVVLSGRELDLEESLKAEKTVFGNVWGAPANLEALAQGSKHK
ncbi:ECHD1 decarboxylase, partial [Polypterus senegalus]